MSDVENRCTRVQPATAPASSTQARHPSMPRPDSARHAERMARVFGPIVDGDCADVAPTEADLARLLHDDFEALP